MNPTVSIVVPTYNCGRFLPEALDSILAQTYPNWEAIIVDDGSTDNTGVAVQSFLLDPRFRYFRIEHLGVSAARNRGITASRGELVAFLDADDRWVPEKLAKQLPLFTSDRTGVVYSLRKTMNEQGMELNRTYAQPYRGDVLRYIFKDNFVCFSSAVVKRAALQAAGPFSEAIPMAVDYDLWIRIARDWDFDFVPESLVWYRTGHANLSRRGSERIQIVLGIMDRQLADPAVARRLGRAWINCCYGETYCTVARCMSDSARAEARGWLWRSLRRHPLNPKAIKELIKITPPFSWCYEFAKQLEIWKH